MKTAVKILLSEIAAKELRIPTLERRGRDCLDFHDVSVWSVTEALCQAYCAGKESQWKTFRIALKLLFDRAEDLIAAIEGTTDQFNDEAGRLKKVVTRAKRILEGGVQ